jgi:hypothetical protein
MARKARSASRSKSPKARRSSTKKSRKSGSRKKVNKWITHVKAQAKKLGLKYGDALSDSRVRNSYKKKK